MQALGTTASRSSQAYCRLRADIITCRLLPDERLRLEDLREHYGLGVGPLREALMQLQAEGLVYLEPNKGFRVLPISREHFLDVMRARAEIDSLCLRLAVENGRMDWETALVASFHRLSRLSKTSDDEGAPGEWRKAHAAFHFTLISGCESPQLTSFHSALADQAERYIAMSVSISDRPRDDLAEHKQLLNAALDRKADEATQLLRQHHIRTTEKLMAAVFEAPGASLLA